MLNCYPFPLDYLDGVNLEGVFDSSRIAALVAKVCKSKQLLIPPPIKEILSRRFFNFLTDQFGIGNVYTGDFVVMVRETLVRLILQPTIAIDSFAQRIPGVAEYIAEVGDLPPPPASTDADAIPFEDEDCGDDCAALSSALHNIGEIYMTGECNLEALRRDLSLSQCITIMHQEPPLLMPDAEPLGLLSIRTLNFVFHVQPTPAPRVFRAVTELLQDYNADHVIYAWNPSGLEKILKERHSWTPTFLDVRPEMSTVLEKENPSFSDLAKKLFRAPLCWKGKIFAGHVRPSYVATHHRAIVVSLVHKAAIKYVRKHTRPQEEAQPDASPIDNREAEEEFRRRQESLDSMDRSIEELQRQRRRLSREMEDHSHSRDRSRPHERDSEDRRRHRASGSRHEESHSDQKRRRY